MSTRTSTWASRLTAAIATGALALVTLPAGAGPAVAATSTLTITASGYVPTALTISTGDSVTFANADTVVHEVSFKSTSGVTCTIDPLVVQPASQQSCTFATAGAFTFSDPKQNGPAFRGSITVKSPVKPTITLVAASQVARYGTSVTLTGTVSPAAAGTSVDIMALAYGDTDYTKQMTVLTAANGTFSAPVTPRIRTSYKAQFQSNGATVTSADTILLVRPLVRLGLRFVRGGYAYFRTSATSAISYAQTRVFAQRRNSAGGWTTVRGVTLGSFSSARFRVAIPRGDSRFRVLLPARYAGPGYLAGFSRSVLVQR